MELKDNTAYWCKTEALATEFLQECKKQEIRWRSGQDIYKTDWKCYKEKTCYVYSVKIDNSTFKNIVIGNFDYISEQNIEIIEYKGVKL